MGREISLFSDYHQKENNLTNHCGVLFRQIYRENPKQFEQLIVALLPEGAQFRVGPVFTQQERKRQSTPDLLIQQDSFSLFFETKIDDWFHDEQLSKHIAALAEAPGIKVLFCLSNFETDDPEKRFSELVEGAKGARIIVQFISFEDLLAQIRELRLPISLIELVEEFELYLDRNGLLPRWRYLLDVVNCGKTMDEIAAGAYMCPNRSGPYTHVRAKYLGTYQNKRVPSIHEIDALIVCTPAGAAFELRWKNIEQAADELLRRAKGIVGKINPAHSTTLKDEGLQIFLLGSSGATDFQKDSPGGLLGSHLYFWDVAKKLEANTAGELAAKLANRKWSEFGH